jgi:hypothetical protein
MNGRSVYFLACLISMARSGFSYRLLALQIQKQRIYKKNEDRKIGNEWRFHPQTHW